MAPGLRANVATRITRGANRAAEHDDFEGLPVRQWRLERTNIVPPERQEQAQQNDKWAVELPHGMPKDSHLLPQHSQDLLRALRSGQFYKRPAPAEEEDTDPDHAVVDKPEKKEDNSVTKGFTAVVWKAIPRNTEGPELSHLAKRRKGTVVLQSKAAVLQSGLPTVTRAKVRRIDAAGNPYIQDVTLADGEQVDGEIISTSVVAAPVSVKSLDGSGSAQTTPVKRKLIIPKKKNKGPGRGRKKKLPLPVSTRPDGSAADSGVESSVSLPNGAQQAADTPSNQDSPMVDDDDCDDEDGDEGDEDTPDPGQDESQDHEMSDVMPEPPAPAAPTDLETASEPTPSPQPLHAPTLALPTISPQVKAEGSPLKNVITPSPTAAFSPEPISTGSPTTASAETGIELTDPGASIAPVTIPEPVLGLSPDAAKGPTAVIKQESPEAAPPAEPSTTAPVPEPILATAEEPSPYEPAVAPELEPEPEPDPEPEPEPEPDTPPAADTAMDFDVPAVPLALEADSEEDKPELPLIDEVPAASMAAEADPELATTPAAAGEDDGDDLLGKLMGSLD